MQTTHRRSRKLCWKFWWLDHSRSQNSQWKLWKSKQASICNRGAGLGHPTDPGVSVQKQNFTRNPEKLAKVPGTRPGSLESLKLTIPCKLANSMKTFLGIIVRQHHTDQRQVGLLKEQCVEWKKVRPLCCCNQVWIKIGSQIPWNAKLICGTFKVSFLMRRHHVRDVSGNHLKDQVFHLVHWLSITLSLRKTSQESINLERKSCLDCSLDMHCTRVNLEGLRTDRRLWGVGDDGRIGHLLEKTQCERGGIPREKENLFFNRRWTNKICWVRSGTENTHHDTGTPNSRRTSRRFCRRIRRVSFTTSRLISGCRWSTKWFLVLFRKLQKPPSRWTQSQTFLAERRIVPYSTELHWRNQNYSYEFGCWAGASHRWLLEYRWVKRFVWLLDRFHSVYFIRRETSRRIYVVRVRLTRKQLTSRPDYLWPELWTKLERNAKLKERQKWSHEQPKLGNARKWRKKLETPVAPAMLCKISKNYQNSVTRGKSTKMKTRLTCILEASESTRLHVGGWQDVQRPSRKNRGWGASQLLCASKRMMENMKESFSRRETMFGVQCRRMMWQILIGTRHWSSGEADINTVHSLNDGSDKWNQEGKHETSSLPYPAPLRSYQWIW